MVSPYYDYQYHYWFRLGEGHANGQMLGRADLPQFVGVMSAALHRLEHTGRYFAGLDREVILLQSTNQRASRGLITIRQGHQR